MKKISFSLLILTVLSLLTLSPRRAFANNTGNVNVRVNVPSNCSISSEDLTLSASIETNSVGTLGPSNLKILCNDGNGLAVYAVGFTNNTYGATRLVSPNSFIATGIAGSPTDSQWSMTVARSTGIANNLLATISDGTNGTENFTQAHVIPSVYTKIATYSSTTDATVGVNIATSYSVYISPTQAAGAYQGKVKYVLVHPIDDADPSTVLTYDANGGSNAPDRQIGTATGTPGTYSYTLSSQKPTKPNKGFAGWSEDPEATTADYRPGASITLDHPATLYAVWREPVPTTLDGGTTVNGKLKRLANSDNTMTYNSTDSLIKSIQKADALPNGFTPSEDNTISTAASVDYPVYIFFDNTNNAGIMYYYSDADIIYLNSNSSSLFSSLYSLESGSGLAYLDTSNVTNMSNMFNNAGRNASNISLNLASWNTSNVQNMSYMFNGFAYSAPSWSINGLSSWNTSSVTNMSYMFQGTARNSTSDFTLNLTGWELPIVQTFSNMFTEAGYTTTGSFTLDLSSWDTTGTRDKSLYYMFWKAGYNASTFSLNTSGWDTSRVINAESVFRDAGHEASTFYLNASGWDVSGAEYASQIFNEAGYSATNYTLIATDWDLTSNSANKSGMFSYVGYSATNSFTFDISGWDTTGMSGPMVSAFANFGYNVGNLQLDLTDWDMSAMTNLSYMFENTGYNSSTLDIDISNWNTSSVTNISAMFYSTGFNATNWSVTIPQTNGAANNPIANTTTRIYGSTTSTYSDPPYGKTFTLATP